MSGEDGQKQESRDVRRYGLIMTLLFVMLFALVLLTGGIYIFEAWTYSKDGTMCVPCAHLGVASNRKVVGIPDEWTQESGSCCATEQNLKKLVQLYVDHWYKLKLDKDNPTFNYCEREGRPEVSTMKLVGATGSSHGNDRHVIHWMQPPEVSFGRSLSYSHGHIHILETGLYWVYSQLVFSGRQTDNLTFFSPATFNHTVLKRYRDEDTVLMTGAGAPKECGGTSSADSTTSYLGSYLLLHEGDSVAVKVYSPTKVKFHSQMNFFGIHKA